MADLGIAKRLEDHPHLQDVLQAAVPLRMQELRALPIENLRPLAQQLRHADEVLFGGPHCASETGALITTLAVLALASEGGVTVANLHWCGETHEGCPTGPQWAHLGEYPLPRIVPEWRPFFRTVRDVPLPPWEGPSSS